MVREEGIGPSASTYQIEILTIILLPHNIGYMEHLVRFERTWSIISLALFTNALLLYNFYELFFQLIIFYQIYFDIIFGFLKS